MSTPSDLTGAAFIAWTFYGSEGWSPQPFASKEELILWITGGAYGSPFIVTTGPLALAIDRAAAGENGEGGTT